MNSRYQRQQRQQVQRQEVNISDYTAAIKANRDWFAAHNIKLKKLEAVVYEATGGVQWSATVEVGHTPEKGSPMGLAFRFVSATFPGVYNPQCREVEGPSNPTFRVWWFTNSNQD